MSSYFVGVVVKELEDSKLLPIGLRYLDVETLTASDYPFTIETLNDDDLEIFSVYEDECIKLLKTGRLLDIHGGEYYYNGTDLVFPQSSSVRVAVFIKVKDFGSINRLGIIYDCLESKVYVDIQQDSFVNGLYLSSEIVPMSVEYTDRGFFFSEKYFLDIKSHVVLYNESIKLSHVCEYKGWSTLFDRVLVIDRLDAKDFIIPSNIQTLILGSKALNGVVNLVIPKTVEYLVYPELSIRKRKSNRLTIYIDAEKVYTKPFLLWVLHTLDKDSDYHKDCSLDTIASKIKELGIRIEFI